MQDIEGTIAEYEESHSKLRGHIHELNEQIGSSKPCKEDSRIRSLLERRSLMYTQLWDIEFAIRSLHEYLIVTNEAGVNKRVG